MATALISDLWTPAVWVEEMAEKQATFPSLFNSGVVTRTPKMDEIASGAGLTANLPFFKDITDQADEIQVENTAPSTDNGITAGSMVATILNRVTKNSVTALAGALSGSDPLGEIIRQMVERRLKQRQTTMLAMLRGQFASAGAANAAAALSAVRLGGTTAEPFVEIVGSQTSAHKVSPDMFIDCKALMGELADDLSRGVLLVHPNIKAALEKLDASGFKTGKPSDLPFDITTYRSIPMFTSEALVRAGTTSGFVYDSYLLAKGVVAYGEKAQEGDTIAVASLQYYADKDKNNEIIYDRTRFLLHTNGLKYTGTPPVGQSATNAELQTAASWNLQVQSAKRVGAVCFRTNG